MCQGQQKASRIEIFLSGKAGQFEVILGAAKILPFLDRLSKSTIKCGFAILGKVVPRGVLGCAKDDGSCYWEEGEGSINARGKWRDPT